MKRKANKTLIGIFAVGAAALLLIAIVVFGSGSLFKLADKYAVFFDGSVKGLSEGAPVVFRGVKIGNITSIIPVYDPERKDVFSIVVLYIHIVEMCSIV